MAALTMGMICGQAKPTSSHAQTIKRRQALGCLDFAVTAAPQDEQGKHISLEMIRQVTRRTAMRYDREGDDHYDIVSAYQKSMRGSDPDAALH